MLAQRKFIAECLRQNEIQIVFILVLSSKPKIEWKNLVLTLMHETDISVSKNPNIAQMSIPGEQSGDKIHQADKISQEEAENRQTLSWPSPFWWSSQADRKVGRGGSNMRQRRNLWVDRSKIDSPWRGYYPQQAPGERCH